MVCVARPSGASVCAHFFLAPTRTPPDQPHSPLPQELHRDLTSCPKPAPNSWGARGAQGRPHLASFFFNFYFLPHPPVPMVLCSTVALVLLYLSFKDPFHCPMCREPCSCLVCLGIPPGFGEPVLSHPPTLEFVCVLFVGNGGKGSFRMKCTLTPHPICCSSSQREVTQCPPLS